MKKIAIAATTAALAAVPAVAAAHPGQGHGQGGGAGPHGLGKAHKQDAPAGHGRCARPQRVGFVAAGSLVSFTPTADATDSPNFGDLVLKVTRANHHAATYTSNTPLSTVGARVSFAGVTDGNADNSVGFDDVQGTDTVMVIGKLVRPKRGCQGDTTVQLRKVMVHRPDAQGSDQEAPEQD
jgi:opacity protein-like surface antigen